MSTEAWREDWIPLGEGKPRTWKEGELTVHRSTAWSAPGCHEGCGVYIYTNDSGKVVKVEGDPDAPFNQGRLCPRCLAVTEMMYDPDRIIYPMRRAVEDRGKDTWERCTWDEAYDGIYEKFSHVKETYGPESIGFCWGTGRDGFQFMQRLAYSIGSPNCIYLLSGTSCYLPRIAAMFNVAGFEFIPDCSQQYADRYDNPNWQAPELYVLWGHNPVYASSDGFFGHWVVDCMKRGSKLITIDPRITWLAARSEMHLQLRPGTDGALAMAALNVIISEELYDKEFVEHYTYGFDELKERVKEWTPEKASDICWLTPERIRMFARAYAQANNGVIHWGLALDMSNRESIPTAQAIIAMVALCGNVDVPGGQQIPFRIQNTGFGWGPELLDPAMFDQRLGLEEYPFTARGFLLVQTESAIKAMLTEKPYPIKALWMETTNPLVNCASDPEELYPGLMQTECNVVLDYVMTPTAMAVCDYFLPVACFPERDGLRVVEGPQFGEVWQAVTTTGEVKSDLQICREMGQRFNPEAWPWDTDRECYTNILSGSKLPLSFEEVFELGPVYPKNNQFTFKKYEKGLMREDGGLGFPTRTGRIELWSLSLGECGQDPLPDYTEVVPGPVSTPELMEEYPLTLQTGFRSINYFHSEHRQAPHLRAVRPDPLVEVSPADAESYALEEGQWVWLENYKGKCQRKVQINEAVPTGLVACDHGFWEPENKSMDDFGSAKRLNCNQLLESKCGKSGFGTNYKATICKMYPVEEVM